jgi:methionyl-tRNA formyltransferase
MVIGVLTSGDLGKVTLEKIILNFNVAFVLTDNNSPGILKTCEYNKIPFFKGNPRKGLGYNFIKNIEVDVIVSVNYLFLIEKDIIQHPKKLIFNIHGSLLPKYRGRTPHVWAIINNEKETGITAHIIDENCDSGHIITQITIPINKRDTGADILNKYKSQYYNLVKKVFEKLKSGKLELIKQDEYSATYFGKRTAEDGKINWNWKKERIVNWIRAQAYPYPGAFSYIKDQKIVIDEVKEVTIEFSGETKSGIILAVTPNIIVNTSNGALELKRVRETLNVKIGDRLN